MPQFRVAVLPWRRVGCAHRRTSTAGRDGGVRVDWCTDSYGHLSDARSPGGVGGQPRTRHDEPHRVGTFSAHARNCCVRYGLRAVGERRRYRAPCGCLQGRYADVCRVRWALTFRMRQARLGSCPSPPPLPPPLLHTLRYMFSLLTIRQCRSGTPLCTLTSATPAVGRSPRVPTLRGPMTSRTCAGGLTRGPRPLHRLPDLSGAWRVGDCGGVFATGHHAC